MTRVMNVSAVRKRLNREHRALGNWRAVAEKYSSPDFAVNVAYVYDLAMKGKVPANQEVRYRLGLEQRPKPEWLGAAVQFLSKREKIERWKVGGRRKYEG